jgi:hypothetical protein
MWLIESTFTGAWSSGLGRRPFKPKIAGSNPVAPTDCPPMGSAGTALRCISRVCSMRI